MRSILVSVFLFSFLASFVFSDDANTLPPGVVRLRLIPSYTSSDKAYDTSGSSVSSGASLAFPSFNLWTASGALEYGVIKGIGIGAQWAPGYNLNTNASNVPSIPGLPVNNNMKFTGPADLQIGAKIQILGADGIIPVKDFRLALTPGIAIPLDKYDADKEAANFLAGSDYRPTSASGHQSFGIGMKGDFDWLLTPSFFINLHGQVSQYLASDNKTFGISLVNQATYEGTYAGALQGGYTQAQAAAAAAAAAAAVPDNSTKTTYGLEYVGEIEPRYQLDLNKDDNIQFALPVTLTTTPQIKEVTTGYADVTLDPTYTVLLRPYVDAFMVLGPLPLEIQAEYDIPVAGKSATGNTALAEATFVAQIKLYYQF